MSEKSELRLIFDTACEMSNLLLVEAFSRQVEDGRTTLEQLGMSEAEFSAAVRECRREMAARLFCAARTSSDFACMFGCERLMAANGFMPEDVATTADEIGRVRRACFIASARFFYDAARPRWTDHFRRGRRGSRRLNYHTAIERLKQGGLALEDIGSSEAESERIAAALWP